MPDSVVFPRSVAPQGTDERYASGAHREGATPDGSEKEGRQKGLVEEISEKENSQEVGREEAVAKEKVQHQKGWYQGWVADAGLGQLMPCRGWRSRLLAAAPRISNNRLADGKPRSAGFVLPVPDLIDALLTLCGQHGGTAVSQCL
jgi:hypothetical protein